MKTCSFDSCEKPSRANALCSGHNMQRSQGRELTPLRVSKYVEFADLLLKGEPDGECLVWTGCTDRGGYGTMGFRGKRGVLVHRAAYELATGADIGEKTVHHKCANRLCFRPEHLELATHRENVGEMFARKGYEAQIAHLQKRVAALEAQLEREWELA